MLPGAQLRRVRPEVGQRARERLVATAPKVAKKSKWLTPLSSP